jgi:hypothetical protein
VTERSPQEGLNRLEALIYPDLHRYIDPASRVGPVAWGVFFTVAQQICAVLRLHSGGFCFSAGPNRRTIIEYILFLCWLADDGEAAVDVLNRSLQNNQKGMSTRLQTASQLEQYPERTRQILAQTIAEPLEPHPDERLLKPWHLIEEYDSTLKSYYAAESGYSHVSMTSIQYFLRQTDDATALSQTPVPEEVVPCVELCLHLFSQAMLVFNELLVGQPWTDDLAAITAEYGLNPRRPQRRRKDT